MGRRRLGPVGVVIVATVVVVPIVTLAILLDPFGRTPRICEAIPVTLEWRDDDGFRRSDDFRLDAARQRVKVDVRVFGDEGPGFLPDITTIYAVGEGTPVAEVVASADAVDERPPTIVLVGAGAEAVNETVDLPAGSWELLASGGAGPATVRWPC